MDKRIPLCIATSDSADFEAGLWIFKPLSGFEVGAGKYAILREGDYLELEEAAQKKDALEKEIADLSAQLEEARERLVQKQADCVAAEKSRDILRGALESFPGIDCDTEDALKWMHKRSAALDAMKTTANAEPKGFFWGRPDAEQWWRCDSLEEAHSKAKAYINENFTTGSLIGYEVGEAIPALIAEDSETTRRNIADTIIEQLDQWAGENSGAEDATFYVADEERDELGNLVMDYVLSKADHHWFTSKPGTVTQHTFIAGSEVDEEGGAA